MDFGGVTYGGAPYGGNLITEADFTISLTITIVFPASFDFFGEVGDLVFIPPDVELSPVNIQYRRSPCLLYEN